MSAVAQSTAAERWVAEFIAGWRDPADPESFADHFERVCTDDVRMIQPQLPTTVGKQAFRDGFVRPTFSLISDLHAIVHDWTAEDDVIYINFTLAGTLGGKPISWPCVDRIVLRDGLGCERRAYFDPTPGDGGRDPAPRVAGVRAGTASTHARRIVSKTATLPQGKISYLDRGEGEPLLFVHGFLVDGRLWKGVAAHLEATHRCIVPDWPMGAHQIALEPDADLSPPGIADLIAAFMDELGLERATVVGNDSGGAMAQVLATRHPHRVERLALTNCDTLEHFPPSVFKALPPLVRVPGGVQAAILPFRLGPVARFTYRQFTVDPVPAELVSSWLQPVFSDRDIRHDTRKLTAGMHKRHTIAAAEKLRTLDTPVRLIWGTDDRFFKLAQARRFAELVPRAEVVEIAGARTFSPLDRPGAVAEAIASFVRSPAS